MLRATYRVQMNAQFTLRQLRATVPYLDQLGISHVYCSPLLMAKPGSRHGYDVVDPCRLNPELGEMDDLQGLCSDLHGRGMGLLLDLVPNHMSASSANPYWMDVLARGERSRYSRWFDIWWTAPGADHKVLLPVLGDTLQNVLERGELRVVVNEADGTAVELAYFNDRFPLRPDMLPEALQLAQWDPEALDDRPGADESAITNDNPMHARLTEASVSALLSADQAARLLENQHYRLMHWREAVVNYRRFFDENSLVALRMEDPAVFDETHATVLDWIAAGLVDGLRIDHVDGLLEPRAYLARLRSAVDARAATSGTRVNEFPIVVEKILGEHEELRRDWPVQGTTGYEFLNDAEDLFVDPDGFARVDRWYRALRHLPDHGFHVAARHGKRRALETGLAPDLDRVAALADGRGADTRTGISELAVALPVYRTYIEPRAGVVPEPDDVQVLTDAIAATDDTAARRLAESLQRPIPDGAVEFVGRFQQLSGPAAARGIEDTAFYVYVPLASRNEVGGSPDRDLTRAVDRFHAHNGARAAAWPTGLVCTDTHDTKRGADVRARLDAVSECAAEWQRCVQRWRRLNARFRTAVDGRLAPDTNAEYLFYQVLIGLWPAPRRGRRVDDLPDASWQAATRARINEYMLKAAREARRCTTWTDPNQAYESALGRFVDHALEPDADAPFLPDVARFVARIADASFWIGASRTLLHLTSPGTPDIYQGTELSGAVLVDPDNRRPVDFTRAQSALAAATDVAGREDGISISPSNASARLMLIERILRARRASPGLFAGGDYTPLSAEGGRARHVVAFARTRGDSHALVVAPRLLGAQAHAPLDAAWWGDTRLQLPPQVRDAFARGSCSDALAARDGPRALEIDALGEVPIASLFSDVPLALLTAR